MSRIKVIKIRDEMRAQLFELEEAIDLTLVALLSRSHLCFLGKPGAAKSATVIEALKHIDLSHFFWLLTKTTTPEEIFGPVRLSALKLDKYTRNTENKLPKADTAFLDETFKANSAILNSLLKAMNEREFDNDDASAAIPLVSLFGASNEMPAEDGLAALWDRFTLRTVVEYMGEDKSFRAMFKAALFDTTADKITVLSKGELAIAQAEVRAVGCDDAAMGVILSIRRELLKHGIEVSPRRWKSALPVLQAQAWLNGRKGIMPDDMGILTAVLWSTPEQRPSVRRVINKVTNPMREQLLDLFDGAAKLWKDWGTMSPTERGKKGPEIHPLLKSAAEKMMVLVGAMKNHGRSVVDLETKVAAVKGWVEQLVQEMLA